MGSYTDGGCTTFDSPSPDNAPWCYIETLDATGAVTDDCTTIGHACEWGFCVDCPTPPEDNGIVDISSGLLGARPLTPCPRPGWSNHFQ